MILAITGGTGFVGQALLDAAERDGIRVRALTRRPPASDRKGVHWVRGHLADRAALAELMRGAGAVIHVAGLTNTPDPAEFEAANVEGTARVIEAAREAGTARFIFVSSLSAREPALSRYGHSKARAEELVSNSGLDWTIVRPPGIYGPRDVDYFEMFRAAKWGVIPVPWKGRSSIIHVADLARLLLALVPGREGISGRIFEPDDGKPGGYAHGELARAIGAAAGRRVLPLHLPDAALRLAARADRILRGDEARLTPDRVGYMTHPDWVCSPGCSVPASLWVPQIAAAEGLAQTAAWYRGQGWL